MYSWKNNKGFTLLEVIVSITIIGLVFTAGYGVYSAVTNSYEIAERNWQLQNDLSKAADYILNELRNAYFLEFSSADLSYAEDVDNYLFVDDSGAIIHRQGGQDVVVVSPLEDDMGYTLNFKAINRDTVEFEVSINNTNFNLSSAVMLANMAKQDVFLGEAPASTIYYRRAPRAGSIPAAELSTFCFIATAAYGSPFQEEVEILRFFRDRCLLSNSLGQKFVQFYYRTSPPVARAISKQPVLKFLTQILLFPLIILAFMILNYNIFLPLVLSTCLAIVGLKYWLKLSQRGAGYVFRRGRFYNGRYW